MTWKLMPQAIGAFLVSILLTAANCFAQGAPISREAYVRAAYEEFHSLLYFLSGNDRFLQGLTPDERSQFDLVARNVVKDRVIFGPGARVGRDRTSYRVDFKLRFSDRNEDFVLNAGEPPRTAKMAGDIWFNLNVINNPQVEFNLLDAFQILFHEFGHKIGDKKNQEVVDSVAAKIRTALGAYHKETVLGPRTKVSSLIIPYLSYDRNPIDYQAEPIVIIDHQGQSAMTHLNVIATQRTAAGYFANPAASQEYSRITLTPKFTMENEQIRIDWRIANRHSFVVAERFNYLDLYTNLEKALPYEKMEAFTETQKLVQYILPEHMRGIANKEYSATEVPVKSINQLFHNYVPTSETRWLDKLKKTREQDGRVEYTTVIETSSPVTEAILMAETSTEDYFKFKGEVTSLGGNIYKLTFSLPTTSARDGELSFYSIGVNGRDLWNLEDVVKMPLKKQVERKSLSPSQIGVLGRDRWQLVGDIRTETLDANGITWRFLYADTSLKIEQIEIMWVAEEKILKDGHTYGTRMKNIFDVIDRKNIRQSVVNGLLVVEVDAVKASQALKAVTNREGFTNQDSFMRAMMQFQITDQNYNTFLTGTRLVRSGWKSVFHIKPQETSSGNRCEALFR